MSILISVSELSKSFAARPLFEGVTFAIESGERIGLIGPNGAGKSTLLKILASQTSADSGKVSIQKGLRVSYLEQTPSFSPGASIHSTLMEGALDPYEWEYMAQADELLSKLSLSDPETLVEHLSGGWKKRVALGRELMRNPDLLLLDEPTNHLDLEGILWLEAFLAQASFATLTITHDRLFLQRISQRILELDRRNPGGILNVQGDYATYLEIKEQKMAAQERREVILKNTLRRETEWLRQGAKARTTKQQARIHRAGDLKNEVEELNYRNQSRTARIDFQSAERNPKKLIEAKGISKSFEHQGTLKKTFENVDLLLSPGSRIGLLGPNGCGKSTLIRVLVGFEEPTTGTVFRSDNLKVSYFEQNREALDPLLTVAKTLCPLGEFVDYRGSRVHIRGYLDRFLFTQGQMDMAVGKLSGGEQSRLLIAKLMLKEANLLILDEPTNDLDMATLSVLEECLVDFPGAVLLVTHDRYFLDQVATKILAFDASGTHPGRILSFVGLDQWESWHQELVPQPLAKAGAKATPASTAIPMKKKKLSFKEQAELDSMEATIQKAEASLAQLTEESLLPANTSNPSRLVEITQKMTKTQAEIDRLYSRWNDLTQD